MQIDVGQTGYYQESDNTQPVCADVDGFGFCGVAGSNLFELPKGAARFETVNQSGLDESLVLEASSLEVMFRDSANLSAARSWGRPGDELLAGLGGRQRLPRGQHVKVGLRHADDEVLLRRVQVGPGHLQRLLGLRQGHVVGAVEQRLRGVEVDGMAM